MEKRLDNNNINKLDETVVNDNDNVNPINNIKYMIDIDNVDDIVTQNLTVNINENKEIDEKKTELNEKTEIDENLLDFNKCVVFTPDNISEIMSSHLNSSGTLLEPAVG